MSGQWFYIIHAVHFINAVIDKADGYEWGDAKILWLFLVPLRLIDLCAHLRKTCHWHISKKGHRM